MKITQTGVGTATHDASIRDTFGHALLPIQVHGDGVTTFQVNGRIRSDAPWVSIISAGTADLLESISWVPFVQLQVTSGAGTVTLWVGEE